MNNELLSSAPLLLQGIITTIALWLTAALVSLALGFAAGCVRSHRLYIPVITPVVDMVTFVLRGVPVYVQVLIFYFVLPDLLRYDLPAFAAAVMALGLCSAAYVSQIVRGGINAIHTGQWEAGYVLGLTTWQTVRYLVLPQMLVSSIPALNGELDQLLKSTSIVATIGVLELTRSGMNIVARHMNPVPVYLSVAALYLVLSSLLYAVTYVIEQHSSRNR